MNIDPEKLARVTSVLTETEASLIVASLAEHGVRAVASGAYTADFRAEVPGAVSILVEAVDLERANVALEDVRREISNIDWSQVDVGEEEAT